MIFIFNFQCDSPTNKKKETKKKKPLGIAKSKDKNPHLTSKNPHLTSRQPTKIITANQVIS